MKHKKLVIYDYFLKIFNDAIKNGLKDNRRVQYNDENYSYDMEFMSTFSFPKSFYKHSVAAVWNEFPERDPKKPLHPYFKILFHNFSKEANYVGVSLNRFAGSYSISNNENVEISKAEIELFFQNLYDYLVEENLVQPVGYPISVRELDSIPPKANPFNYDLVRSGVNLHGDLVAMYESTEEAIDEKSGETYKVLPSLILINTRTGRRFELDLSETYKALSVENAESPE